MAEQESQNDITRKTVVLKLEGMNEVVIQRDISYHDDPGKLMDIYCRPETKAGDRGGIVIIVGGYPGGGYEKFMGCRFKEMGWSVSWAKLLAVTGVTTVVYDNREPEADLHRLIEFIRSNADELKIDTSRVGLFAGSGNVPAALSASMDESLGVKCTAFCYGYMLDSDSSTAVADASRQWGFVNPCAGRSIADVRNIPMLLVRAGLDQFPGLNDAIDRFAGDALSRNLPLTLINHPTGPHAFDLTEDSYASRKVIQQVLYFMRSNLVA